jgi:hypothetical protein
LLSALFGVAARFTFFWFPHIALCFSSNCRQRLLIFNVNDFQDVASQRDLQGKGQGLAFGATTRGTFDCLLLEEDALRVKGVAELPPDREDAWYCQTSDNLVYEINRPAAWFKNRGAVSGETILAIPEADKVNGGFDFKPQMKINDESKIKQSKKNGGRRELAPKTGVNTMLVIRGKSGDGAPTKSTNDLAVDVFGSLAGGVDPVNLASQYSACSKGALTFAPATGGNGSIVNGAVEVTIPDNIAGMNRITAHNLFINAAPARVGVPLSTWTQVFLVMQETVNFEGAAAYAYIGGSLSVYLNNYATMVVVQVSCCPARRRCPHPPLHLLLQMHEIGELLSCSPALSSPSSSFGNL